MRPEKNRFDWEFQVGPTCIVPECSRELDEDIVQISIPKASDGG